MSDDELSHKKQESALFSTEQLNEFNKRLLELFEETDDNGTNTVDIDGFTALMNRIIPNPNESHIETLFKTIDVNNSGTINYRSLLNDNKFTLFILNSVMIQQSMTINNNIHMHNSKSVNFSKRNVSVTYSNTEIEHTLLGYDDDEHKVLNHFPTNTLLTIPQFHTNTTHKSNKTNELKEYKEALIESENELNQMRIKYENILKKNTELMETNENLNQQINEFVKNENNHKNQMNALQDQIGKQETIILHHETNIHDITTKYGNIVQEFDKFKNINSKSHKQDEISNNNESDPLTKNELLTVNMDDNKINILQEQLITLQNKMRILQNENENLKNKCKRKDKKIENLNKINDKNGSRCFGIKLF